MSRSGGRHVAARAKRTAPMAGAAGVVAAAGAAMMGLTPTMAASPQLMGEVYYVPGTNIGTPPADFPGFVTAMIDGADLGAPTALHAVEYPGGFWPASRGGFSDPTFDASVAQGVQSLNDQPIQSGDTVFGFSQGAVVVSKYKSQHGDDPTITYVLVENPNRPNGGLLARFNGLHIPILDVSFDGATPDTASPTVDISRQYDGFSDFPAYPINVLADLNAIAGIVYLHGNTQALGADALDGLKTAENTMYYQQDGNTEYYLIPTDELPILMPFDGIVPDPLLKAIDPPLRYLIELGYDRSDYGKPTPAGVVPRVDPVTVVTGLADATAAGVQTGLDQSAGRTGLPVSAAPRGTVAPNFESPEVLASTRDRSAVDVPEIDVRKEIPSKSRKAPKSATTGNAGPVASLHSAVTSISKSLGPKAKAPASKDSASKDSASRGASSE